MKEYPLKVRVKQVDSTRYEVEGVIFYAKSRTEAVKKWCRTKKPKEVER